MIIIKIASLYLITIFIMRVMGKSTIVQMTPYDLVAIIIIGTIASEPLISTEYKPTLINLLILVCFHLFFSFLTLKQIGNKFFLGEPTILIKKGEILENNLKKSRLSIAQLLSILRSEGYPKVSDIDYAILEPIGAISIIPKVENTPVTVEHMNISIDDEGLPISVIIDGKIQEKNLELLGKNKDWLLYHLKQKNADVSDIIYAFICEKTKSLTIKLRSSLK
ncbi:DUF421 domain-containing protein [Inediibacterium massiliense]|uniref:DUF421 domain-containing protein n=1 Tax=Inediibacterium massiliense TaxID=1658111 RepID=UPI000A887453|nr:DUF421 domain-containing protein [Inediibacterium massiliense]